MLRRVTEIPEHYLYTVTQRESDRMMEKRRKDQSR